MQNRSRRSAAVLLLLSTHPGPSFAVAAMCTMLGITVLDGGRVALLGLAVLLGQFSVGLSNDWLDAQRDRIVGRTDKPVATGQITSTTVRNASLLTGVAGVLLMLPLGWLATLAHAIFIAAGWAYNLGLKKTALSVLPYLIGFGTLPAVITLARDTPAVPAWWAMAAGATLGVAAHFANALPDIADDRATGIVGLPHRVSSRASSLVTFGALAAATITVVVGSGTTLSTIGLITIIAETIIVLVGIYLALTRAPARPLFRLVILGALIAVVSLVLAGEKIVS